MNKTPKRKFTPLDLYSEADLAEDLVLPKTQSHFPPKNIFFTGVTGNFGSHLLDKAAQVFKEANLYCLVRAGSKEEANNKIVEAFKKRQMDLSFFIDRLHPVLGDLTKSSLGIDPKEYERLAEKIDLIFHSGAATNWSHSYDMLKPANVGGTYELIKFASTKIRKPIHHISTIGALPFYKNENYSVISEDMDIRHNSAFPQTAYSRSKWVCEMQMHHARELGLKVNIYRPGQLVCDLEHGLPVKNEFSYLIVEGCRQLKCAPDIPMELTLTPHDVAAEIIATIASKDQDLNHNYNIVNPISISLREVLHRLSAQGSKIEFASLEEWLARIKTLDLSKTRNPLVAILDYFLEVFLQNPTEMQVSNTLKAIAGTKIIFPVPKETLMDVYLKGF